MTLKIPTKEEIIKDMITNPQNYAAIYARQSNLKTSNSLSSQILKGQELALKNNLLIYKTYAEKISATESYFTERKEFNQLILDAKAGFFKTVIVFKRDRLARRIEDFLEIKKIFKTLGIKILYSNEEEFQGNDTHISDFIENIIMAVSEFEPKNIKSRTEEGRKKKREKGEYYGKPPFGYEAIKGNSTINSNSNDERIVSKYKINNNEAHIVKTIFQIFVENEEIKTTKDISNKLLELNITLPQNLNESKIRSIINRPVYAALQTISLDYKYNNFRLIDKDNNLIPIELKYFHNCTNVDKIINKETWLKAVYKWIKLHPNERRVKKKRRKKKYLFKDILYCSNCGNKITLSGESYSCKTKGCTRVKKDILIKTLLTKLLYNLLNEENIDTAITSNNNILKKELKKYCNTLTILIIKEI